MSEPQKLSPTEWELYFGIIIHDPDGWNRNAENWEAEWNTPITAAEFRSKARESTIDVIDNDKFVRRYMIK